MKEFTVRTAKFFFFVTLLLVSTLFAFVTYSKQNANFALPENTRNVIFGHSHGACAFNDSILEKTVNLCDLGESYFYMYPKVKAFVSNNPQIKNVFVVVAENQFSIDMDKAIGTDKYLSFYYARYFPFMDLESHFEVLKQCWKGVIANVPVILKTQAKAALAGNNKYYKKFGGYTPQVNILELQDSVCTFDSAFVHKDTIASVNIDYLQKITTFCRAQNVNVYFVRCPQHICYRVYQNETIFFNVLSTKFKNIPFLDFSNYAIQNNQFADLHHLNNKGALVFSKYFNTFVIDTLNKSTNSY